MGGALVEGLIASGTSAASITVAELFDQRRAELAERYGVTTTAEVVPSKGALLATKPDGIAKAAADVAKAGTERVLSVAAGVSIATLEAQLNPGTPVVRAMPNTPALVRAGAAAFAANDQASDDDVAWAEAILNAVGVAVQVPEKLLDAVTGLSGSGPAYVFLVAEALIEAGVAQGIPRAETTTLVAQTLLGSATLLTDALERGTSPAKLRADVTSPGGTTAAGLFELEAAATRAAFGKAVAAATRRSVELGKPA